MNLESLFAPPKNKSHYSQIKANEKSPAVKEQFKLPITKYYTHKTKTWNGYEIFSKRKKE